MSDNVFIPLLSASSFLVIPRNLKASSMRSLIIYKLSILISTFPSLIILQTYYSCKFHNLGVAKNATDW